MTSSDDALLSLPGIDLIRFGSAKGNPLTSYIVTATPKSRGFIPSSRALPAPGNFGSVQLHRWDEPPRQKHRPTNFERFTTAINALPSYDWIDKGKFPRARDVSGRYIASSGTARRRRTLSSSGRKAPRSTPPRVNRFGGIFSGRP